MPESKSAKSKTGKAIRPIFIPNKNKIGVIEKKITFDWHMGMTAAVRKRSVVSLHEQAKHEGFKKILEASSKSENRIGISLSAFFLKDDDGYPVENLYQSSKVLTTGGPYLDLLSASPRDAKRDERLKKGNIISFVFNGKPYPTTPFSLFYDWLYMKTLFTSNNNIGLKETFLNSHFDAFSDIEFNPKKSIACQARTLALCVSIHHHESIAEFLKDPESFNKKYQLYSFPKLAEHPKQRDLF